MARSLGAVKSDPLVLRILSATVMAPLAVCAAWVGGAFLAVLVVVAAGLMGWEWGRLTDGGRFSARCALVVVTEVSGVALAAFGWPGAALALLAAGALTRSVWTRAEGDAGVWAGVGTLWIGASCVALIWLAADLVSGRVTVLWLFVVVWATDSAAYLVGRWLGGPRLAPRWSPKKTWSGAVGGVVAAGLVGLVTANILGISALSPVSWVSLGLSVAAQAGDLAESAAKRRFGVKDTSGLIPGHGGLLDRLDGMLAALAAVALLTLAGGASPVVWS